MIRTHSARKAQRRAGMSVSPAPNDSAALSFRSRPAAGAGFVSVAVWNLLSCCCYYVHHHRNSAIAECNGFLASRRR